MRRSFLRLRKALLENRMNDALEYNRQALLNFEFARQSVALAKSAERLQERVKGFMGNKSADADVRYFVN